MSFTVFEEDISNACNLAQKHFGKLGTLIYPSKNALLNHQLSTKEHGRIWYGDIDKSSLSKIQNLESELGVEVLVTPL